MSDPFEYERPASRRALNLAGSDACAYDVEVPAFCSRCHKRPAQCTCRLPAPFRRYLREEGESRFVPRSLLVPPLQPARPRLDAYVLALHAGALLINGKRFGGLTDSDERTRDCHFNRVMWARVRDGEAADDDDEPYKLVLRAAFTPSGAVNDMFAHLEDWAFDCGEALQMLRWYAQLRAMGDLAFNRKMRGLGRFELREHDSSGLTSTRLYLRVDGEGDYDKNARFRLQEPDEQVVASAETLLANAPMGSRVLWRNFDPAVDDDDAFKNENAMKLGRDQFFAHPMGFKTQQELVRELAQTADESLDDDQADAYAAKYIRLADVEHYAER